MPSNFYIESLRVADAMSHRFPGSVEVPCIKCKEDVVISGSTKPLLAEGASPICSQCQKQSTRPVIEVVLQESIDELERWLDA